MRKRERDASHLQLLLPADEPTRVPIMQAVLVMFRNDGERRSFSISRENTVIGRRQDCDLMIPLGEISRKHCRIVRDGDTLRIEDLGSSNGTFHNGRRIQEAVLSPGDTIQVGPVTFVIQINGVPEDDEIRPHAAGGAAAATLADDEDALETLPDDDDLEATPSSDLDTDEEPADVALDEEEAMEKPVIRKAAAAAEPEPEPEEAADDETAPAAAEDEELQSLEADDAGAGIDKNGSGELDSISLDDGHDVERPKPARASGANEDDLLDVLSGDDEEVGEIDHSELLEVDEDAEEDVSLDDEKSKHRK
jgi:pSer/pThr/pTyr-binding forkhead associated (FHA) protein